MSSPTRPTLSPAGALAPSQAGRAAGRLEAAHAALAARELEPGDLTATWELVARAALPPEEAEGFFYVLAALFEARRQGDTCLAFGAAASLTDSASWPELLRSWATSEAIAEKIARFLREHVAPPRPRTDALGVLLGGPEDERPLVRLASPTGLTLAFQRDVAKERRLAQAALARLVPSSWSASQVGDALASTSASARPLVAEQRHAVVQALTRRLALIAGGPGTGKTTIILSVVRAALALGVDPTLIALAAPTGKAARRIEEALGELRQDEGLSASTLHALLGLGPGLVPSPLFRAEGPLPHRLVIVDEASMIGLDHWDLLVAAVAPDATLVLLGDPDQLPSVEAGALFKALVDTPALAATRLTHSHRMRADDPEGAAILGVARAVNAGTWPTSLPEAPHDEALPTRGVFAVAERLPVRFFGRWQAQHLAWRQALVSTVSTLPAARVPRTDAPALAATVDEAARTRLLAVTRGRSRPTGVAAVNAWFHEAWAARARRSEDEPIPWFLPGEPVMVTENDPERGLANGDTGVVLRVAIGRAPATSAVAFSRGDELALFPLAGLERRLSLAYATTVHKAQGSEHDHVALLLPDEELPLFGRELLYTALTRARRSVLLVGDSSRARAAATRATARRGTLAHWLAALNAMP